MVTSIRVVQSDDYKAMKDMVLVGWVSITTIGYKEMREMVLVVWVGLTQPYG